MANELIVRRGVIFPVVGEGPVLAFDPYWRRALMVNTILLSNDLPPQSAHEGGHRDAE